MATPRRERQHSSEEQDEQHSEQHDTEMQESATMQPVPLTILREMIVAIDQVYTLSLQLESTELLGQILGELATVKGRVMSMIEDAVKE